jgi:hypothetical protein
MDPDEREDEVSRIMKASRKAAREALAGGAKVPAAANDPRGEFRDEP